MNKKCPKCGLINFQNVENCVRCQTDLTQVQNDLPAQMSVKPQMLKRFVVLVIVCVASLFGFYLSLLFSASKLNFEEKRQTERAIMLLSEKGFATDVFLLRYLTAFRANDNWLNASIEKENAYAATNFPFEIMTLYPDFFTIPLDDTERAAILLHEARHLQGADEKEAYEFVWKNRRQLGWTKENYANSIIWRNVRKQTQEYAPHLFICDWNEYSDCTEQ